MMMMVMAKDKATAIAESLRFVVIIIKVYLFKMYSCKVCPYTSKALRIYFVPTESYFCPSKGEVVYLINENSNSQHLLCFFAMMNGDFS